MKGMKKKVLAFAAAAVLMAPQMVGAEGFAIYEWSAEGMGMAGARMFAENDAANLAYNPASITKVKGEAAKISATYLSPHGKYDLEGVAPGYEASGHNRVHPAWAPGMYYVKQINDKEWFGMGTYSRFGMVSQFERNSAAGVNSFSAKLNGISLGANYARKMDKKWTASLGAEVNYVGLQMDKQMYHSVASQYVGTSPLHLEGDSYALGWNASANYEFDDKNEIGLVYRSAINHSMEADLDAHGGLVNFLYGTPDVYGNAYACVTLPESLTLGYNHKFNERTRVELNYIWTRWERYDALNISASTNVGGMTMNSEKNWSNGKRFAIGLEHKFSDKYSGMLGYAFDHSNIPYDGGDFMIPTGTRTTYSIGAQYHDKKQTLAVALGWMNVGSLDFKGHAGDPFDSAHTRDSYTKMASISYQRNF